jgi:hypothetical protein
MQSNYVSEDGAFRNLTPWCEQINACFIVSSHFKDTAPLVRLRNSKLNRNSARLHEPQLTVSGILR